CGTRTRDSAAVAERYLQGLAQAEEATFAAMATVVEQGCEQQFQHFISNSPWRHEPVGEQICRDNDRLLVGKTPSGRGRRWTSRSASSSYSTSSATRRGGMSRWWSRSAVTPIVCSVASR